jgi:hypothetical protein
LGEYIVILNPSEYDELRRLARDIPSGYLTMIINALSEDPSGNFVGEVRQSIFLYAYFHIKGNARGSILVKRFERLGDIQDNTFRSKLDTREREYYRLIHFT